jgi:mRNA-degrading endonuclease toxin of MazEF toxin-antitoxin module
MGLDPCRLSRRRLLSATGLAAVSLAGCSAAEEPATTTDDVPAGDTATPTDGRATGTEGRATTSRAGTEDASPTPTLDLQEANVTAVTVSGERPAIRFDVTLYHDDDGEAGYANWWQVETLDGEQLGRRVLTHPHATAPFTRSATVEIPDGVACVVVRGHDQTHGYGGQAMLVDLDGGSTRAVRQGAEPREVDDGDCPRGR